MKVLEVDLEEGQVRGTAAQADERPVKAQGLASFAPVKCRARVQVVDGGDAGGEVRHVRPDADDPEADSRSARGWIAVLDGARLCQGVQRHRDNGADVHVELLLHREAGQDLVRGSGQTACQQLGPAHLVRRQTRDVGVVLGHDPAVRDHFPVVVGHFVVNRRDARQRGKPRGSGPAKLKTCTS